MHTPATTPLRDLVPIMRDSFGINEQQMPTNLVELYKGTVLDYMDPSTKNENRLKLDESPTNNNLAGGATVFVDFAQ